jgi:chloramphenicol-sensitive protein RarD
MIQYITPVLQMLWAVFVVHEQIEPARWVGFGLIWVAVIIFTTDTLFNVPRRPRLTQPTHPSPKTRST